MRGLAEIFKALSEETRLQIMGMLRLHGELCVCDVEGALEITQSKPSRHLRTLLHEGLAFSLGQGGGERHNAGTLKFGVIPNKGTNAFGVDIFDHDIDENYVRSELFGHDAGVKTALGDSDFVAACSFQGLNQGFRYFRFIVND